MQTIWDSFIHVRQCNWTKVEYERNMKYLILFYGSALQCRYVSSYHVIISFSHVLRQGKKFPLQPVFQCCAFRILCLRTLCNSNFMNNTRQTLLQCNFAVKKSDKMNPSVGNKIPEPYDVIRCIEELVCSCYISLNILTN